MPDEKKPVMRPVEELEEEGRRELPPEARNEAEGPVPVPTLPPFHAQPFPNILPQSDINEETLAGSEDDGKAG